MSRRLLTKRSRPTTQLNVNVDACHAARETLLSSGNVPSPAFFRYKKKKERKTRRLSHPLLFSLPLHFPRKTFSQKILSKFQKTAWEKTSRGETSVHIASEHDSLIPQRKPRPIFTHLTIKSNNRPNTVFIFAIKSRDFGTGKTSFLFRFLFFYYYYFTQSGKIQRRPGDDTVLRIA